MINIYNNLTKPFVMGYFNDWGKFLDAILFNIYTYYYFKLTFCLGDGPFDPTN